jgi:uncharacterized protein GlcG (DUF336 family)
MKRLLALCFALVTSALSAQVMPTPVPGQEAGQTSSSESLTTGPAVGLSSGDIQKILDQAEAASSRTVSLEGLRTTPQAKHPCRHHIYIVDRTGKVLGERHMPDAWVGSLDIALGKARTAVFFSSDQNALSTRQLGQLSQAHGPDGNQGAGPLWGIWATNQHQPPSQDGVQRNCVVTFPGGLPLYKNGHLAGAIGVSGDGVDQDESVAFAGAMGFMAPTTIGTPTPLKPKPVDWLVPGQ